MRRILIYLGIGLTALVLLLLGTVFVFPKTPVGQRIIDSIARPRIERIVEQQLGSDIRFERIRGALPGEIIISDLSLSQEGEDWLTADTLTLRWSPLAALSRDIRIELLSGSNIILYREPVLPERPEKDEPATDKDRSLFPLPKILVGEFSVDSFSIREPVFGERYDLTFKGHAKTENRHATASFELDTTSDSDSLRLEMDYDRDRLQLSGSALSAPNGLITTALGAEDTVWFTLDGSGPLDDWQGTIEGEAGLFGGLSGDIGGDLVSFEDARFSLNIVPGPLLPETSATIVGDALYIRGDTKAADDRIVLTLNEARARFGEIAGTVSLPMNGKGVYEADISGELSKALAADYDTPMLAGPVTLKGQFERGDIMSFAGELETKLARLTVTDGTSGEEMLFTGKIAFDARDIPFSAGQIDPILAQGGRVSGDLSVTDDIAVSLTNMTGQLGAEGQRITLSGNAAYTHETGAVDATLAGNLGPDAFALLTGQALFAADLPYRLSASGTAQDAKADMTLRFPQGSYEEISFTPGTLSANLTGLPSRPAGTIRLQSSDESYRGYAELASTENRIALPRLTFTGGNLTLEGNAAYQPANGSAEAKLALNSPTPTTLITGQTIAGAMNIDARLDGNTDSVEATGTLERFRYGEYDIASAEFTAGGTLANLRADVTAQGAYLPGVYLAKADIGTVWHLDGETRSAEINRLVAAVDEDTEKSRITLISPTRLTLGETISLSQTQLDWLGDGEVTASGSFAPTHWVADVSLESVELPRFTSPVTGTFTLDTNEETPARFTASATASPEESDDTYRLAAEGNWSGETLTFTSTIAPEGGQSFITSDVKWPLHLTRTNGRISIARPEEEISGTVRAKGDISPLYAFIPSVPPYFTGELEGAINLSGTPNAPLLEGRINLADGRFEEPSIGITMTELTGVIELGYSTDNARGRFDIVGAGASGRDKSVNLQGTVELAGDKSAVDAKLVLNDATIVDGPNLKVRTGADLALTGTFDDLKLAGTVDIGQIDSGIPDSAGGNGEGVPTYTEVNVVRVDGPEPELAELKAPKQSAPNVTLDLHVTAENEIFIRGRGLDTEWRANLDVDGTSAAPVIDGDIILRRGSLDFAGRTFDFDRGRIEFQPHTDTLATINARAGYNRDEVDAYVNVGGTVTSPEISLSSNPPMPEEDVMALILFGKQPTELSALESLQIANALRSLAGIGPSFGGGTGLQSTLGLDALSFGVDEATGEGVVQVGKYISDDLYVSARQTARGTSSEVTVTYELTDDVTVESTLQPNGAQDVSVNYKKDY
ncbi:translocation/assembly module TamB domain-containing protein [Parvularcula marina]|uniref:translocation/assembly module TamB domain-containing protein n=1 Tax=Parvularcula marina TaxID=2292771 RepID=UPI003514B853